MILPTGGMMAVPSPGTPMSYSFPITSGSFLADDFANPTPTSRQIFTVSCWLKAPSVASSIPIFEFFSDSPSSTLQIRWDTPGDREIALIGSDSLGSFSAFCAAITWHPDTWSHFVVAVDTTQVILTDRVKFYFEGDQYNTDSISLAQNRELPIFPAGASGRNWWIEGGDVSAPNFMAFFQYVDGQQLPPSAFTDGIGRHIPFSGNMGVLGTYLIGTPSESVSIDLYQGKRWFNGGSMVLDSSVPSFAYL